jgi:hypothetical protein
MIARTFLKTFCLQKLIETVLKEIKRVKIIGSYQKWPRSVLNLL